MSKPSFAVILGAVALILSAGCSSRDTGTTVRDSGSDLRDSGGDQGRPDATGDQDQPDTTTDTAVDTVQDVPPLDLPEGALSIYDIQDETSADHPACSEPLDLPGCESSVCCAAAAPVTVAGIITAIDTRQSGDDPDSVGSFWIQDPTGGPYSGVQVFNPGAETADTSTLAVGMTVQVTGEYVEAYGLTEIRVDALEVLNATPQLLAPTTVNPADVATGGAQAEAYEGVLIQIETVTVTDAGVGHGQFEVTGGLLVDDELYNPSPFPQNGAQFTRIAGVLTFTFEEFALDPRDADDLEGENIEPTGLTIYDLQDETSEDFPGCTIDVPAIEGCRAAAPSTVQGVITAIDRVGSGNSVGSLYIQDPAGGAYSGIFVYNPGGGDINTTNLEVGMTFEVTGTYTEAFGLSELGNVSGQVIDETINPIVPEVVAAADVADGGSLAASYVGVLVTVEGPTVTDANPDAPGDFGAVEITGGLILDDDQLQWDPRPALDDAFDSITGVLTYTFDHYRLIPRSMQDLVPAE